MKEIIGCPALCECGCGERAPLAQKTNSRKGEVRGEPLRFIAGHNRRHTTNLSRHRVVDGGFVTPCWMWLGPINRKGYGFCQVNGVRKNAHRALYEARRGEVPSALHIDHLCRNKWCVNPDHGEPVTPLVNERRKRAALRVRAEAAKP